jgi:hypothetical protein
LTVFTAAIGLDASAPDTMSPALRRNAAFLVELLMRTDGTDD